MQHSNQLFSNISSDGQLEFSLREVDVPTPKANEVVDWNGLATNRDRNARVRSIQTHCVPDAKKTGIGHPGRRCARLRANVNRRVSIGGTEVCARNRDRVARAIRINTVGSENRDHRSAVRKHNTVVDQRVAAGNSNRNRVTCANTSRERTCYQCC